MAMTVHCDIVSAEQNLFADLVEYVIASSETGELGIWPHHTPLLARLKPGPVRVRKQNGDEEIFYVSGGFLEVQPRLVTVLCDTAERAENMDEAQAQQARDRARQDLDGQKSDLDYSRAASELAEATAQLRTIEELKKKAQR